MQGEATASAYRPEHDCAAGDERPNGSGIKQVKVCQDECCKPDDCESQGHGYHCGIQRCLRQPPWPHAGSEGPKQHDAGDDAERYDPGCERDTRYSRSNDGERPGEHTRT